MAVSRSACAGWWGRSWPRNGGDDGALPNDSAWQHAYTYARCVQSRLKSIRLRSGLEAMWFCSQALACDYPIVIVSPAD